MKSAFILIFLFISLNVSAKTPKVLTPNIVNSIEGTVDGMLTMITGDKNKDRDWELLKSFFTKEATFSVLIKESRTKNRVKTSNLKTFIKSAKKYYKYNSHHEFPIKNTVHEYGGIAQVFQSYEVQEPNLKERGINSIQLVFDGERWWITSILWTNEDEKELIPEEFLK